MSDRMVKVTLRKSGIGTSPRQRKTLKSLGLKKIGAAVILKDCPPVRGMLGAVAVATKHEIVLAIIGGLFVLEAVSVIVQVVSYRLTGRRVFRMAPIHHHFEKLGWTEPQIVIRFWIISVMLALAGLSTLKLR